MQFVHFVMSLSKAALFPRNFAPLGTSGGKCRAQEYHTRDTVFNHKIPQRVHFYKTFLWKEIITCLVFTPYYKTIARILKRVAVKPKLIPRLRLYVT